MIFIALKRYEDGPVRIQYPEGSADIDLQRTDLAKCIHVIGEPII